MRSDRYIVLGQSLESIRNICELMVIEAIKKLIPLYPTFDHCTMCVEDVYALSLSRLPATYAHAGSIILNKEVSQSDVEDVVRYAILQVADRPKHNN